MSRKTIPLYLRFRLQAIQNRSVRDFDAFVREATSMRLRDRLGLAWGIVTKTIHRP